MQAAPQSTSINTTTAAASLQSTALGTTQNGDSIIVFVEMDATNASTFTMVITDTAGNTYTQIASYVNANANKRLSAWYSTNIVGGASFKVTATPSASAALALACFWVPGAKLITPIDGSASTTGSSTSPAAGNTAVTNNGELILTGFSSVAAGTITATPPAGYVQGPSNLAGTTLPIIDTAYNVAASGTFNPTWTIVSAAWAAISCSILGKSFPVIQVNSGTGSDTAASGAGQASAVTGTAAATNATGRVVTITDAVALGGVALDGSAVLYLIDTTAGHRVFDQIANITGSSGNWTVTVVNGFAINLTAKSWAIGGVRASIASNSGNALSLRLFDNNSANGDAMSGWITEMQSGHAETIANTIQTWRTMDFINGTITIRGKSGAATQPIITFSNNGAAWGLRNPEWHFENFEIKNSNVTKNASVAFSCSTGLPQGRCVKIKCADAANAFWKFSNGSSGNANLIQCEDCYIANTVATAFDFSVIGNGSANIRLKNSELYLAGGAGIDIESGNGFIQIEIENSIIAFCAGNGIHYGSNNLQPNSINTTRTRASVRHSVIHGNSGDGIKLDTVPASYAGLWDLQIENVIFSFNTGFGINVNNAGIDDFWLSQFFVKARGLAFFSNTAGKYPSWITTTTSINEQTGDPAGGLSAANKDYAGTVNGRNFMSTAYSNLGYPLGGTQAIGTTGSTFTYFAIGFQPQSTGGTTVNNFITVRKIVQSPKYNVVMRKPIIEVRAGPIISRRNIIQPPRYSVNVRRSTVFSKIEQLFVRKSLTYVRPFYQQVRRPVIAQKQEIIVIRPAARTTPPVKYQFTRRSVMLQQAPVLITSNNRAPRPAVYKSQVMRRVCPVFAGPTNTTLLVNHPILVR